jgi:aminoglycoside phosphotransferase (APT) family kinase protein
MNDFRRDTATVAQKITSWAISQGLAFESGCISDFVPMSGGQSSEMFEFRCMNCNGEYKSYVVRIQPQSDRIFMSPSIMKEYEIQLILREVSHVPVPRMVAYEESRDVLGEPFLVMEKVNAFAPLARPSIHLQGPLISMCVEDRSKVAKQGIKCLVDIHSIPIESVMPLIVKPDFDGSGLAEHLDYLARWYSWVIGGRKFPITDTALKYLKKNCHVFDSAPRVIVWNDARIGNMMFNENADLVAVLDWEGVTTGPAGIDIGYWLMMDEFHAEAIGVDRLPGWLTRDETLSIYNSQVKNPVCDLKYFIILAAFFIATTIIRQADLAVAGGYLSPSTRMGHDNTATQILARNLSLNIPMLCDDYCRHRKLPIESIRQIFNQ